MRVRWESESVSWEILEGESKRGSERGRLREGRIESGREREILRGGE